MAEQRQGTVDLNSARALIDTPHHAHVEAIQKVQTDTQNRLNEVYLTYHSTLQGSEEKSGEKELSAELNAEYLKSVQSIQEECQGEMERIKREYVQSLQEVWNSVDVHSNNFYSLATFCRSMATSLSLVG